MRNLCLAIIALLVVPVGLSAQRINIKRAMRDAEKQTTVMLHTLDTVKRERADLISPRTVEKGKLKLVPSRDWTSGFFCGPALAAL